MATKIQKWGNSLAVRLPKEMADKLSLKEGSWVELISRMDSLVMKHVNEPELNLKEMLAKIKPENLHEEWDMGPPRGKEIW